MENTFLKFRNIPRVWTRVSKHGKPLDISLVFCVTAVTIVLVYMLKRCCLLQYDQDDFLAVGGEMKDIEIHDVKSEKCVQYLSGHQVRFVNVHITDVCAKQTTVANNDNHSYFLPLRGENTIFCKNIRCQTIFSCY